MGVPQGNLEDCQVSVRYRGWLGREALYWPDGQGLSWAAPGVDVQLDLDSREEQKALVTWVEMQLRMVVVSLRRIGAFGGCAVSLVGHTRLPAEPPDGTVSAKGAESFVPSGPADFYYDVAS